ncbi:hypothetical protein MPER_12783 [Moniliophthora perniciosa FA553]|nr:hypothetical protein MPER_12783 [Moniliophthora perniciosa FA553]
MRQAVYLNRQRSVIGTVIKDYEKHIEQMKKVTESYKRWEAANNDNLVNAVTRLAPHALVMQGPVTVPHHPPHRTVPTALTIPWIAAVSFSDRIKFPGRESFREGSDDFDPNELRVPGNEDQSRDRPSRSQSLSKRSRSSSPSPASTSSEPAPKKSRRSCRATSNRPKSEPPIELKLEQVDNHVKPETADDDSQSDVNNGSYGRNNQPSGSRDESEPASAELQAYIDHCCASRNDSDDGQSLIYPSLQPSPSPAPVDSDPASQRVGGVRRLSTPPIATLPVSPAVSYRRSSSALPTPHAGPSNANSTPVSTVVSPSSRNIPGENNDNKRRRRRRRGDNAIKRIEEQWTRESRSRGVEPRFRCGYCEQHGHAAADCNRYRCKLCNREGPGHLTIDCTWRRGSKRFQRENLSIRDALAEDNGDYDDDLYGDGEQ